MNHKEPSMVYLMFAVIASWLLLGGTYYALKAIAATLISL